LCCAVSSRGEEQQHQEGAHDVDGEVQDDVQESASSTSSSFDTMEGETDRHPVNFTVGEEEEVSGTQGLGVAVVLGRGQWQSTSYLLGCLSPWC
jgi:hypothetical protein